MDSGLNLKHTSNNETASSYLKKSRSYLFFDGNNFPGIASSMQQVEEIQAFRKRHAINPSPSSIMGVDDRQTPLSEEIRSFTPNPNPSTSHKA